MQDRNKFTEIEDFLADKSFRQWVKFQIDDQKWEEWTLENSARARLVEESRLWLLAMKVSDVKLSKQQLDVALERSWIKINAIENDSIKVVRKRKQVWNKNWFKAVAAILLFGIFGSWIYVDALSSTITPYVYNELTSKNEDGLVEQTNNSNKPQIITLSDGSSILLQPNSKLSYPKIFAGTYRKVYLSGEGFFEISKNPNKPFFVYANEIVTKVVGTSFRIKAYENQPNIEVLVRTGKVKVKVNRAIVLSNEEEVELLPNQALRVVRKDLQFNKITDITADLKLISSSNTIEKLSFNFLDTPVIQIFKTIEQAYLVEINFPVEKLINCYLTTSLNDQPLPEKLKIICKSLGNNTSYEMNGNQITITSQGCD